MTTLAEKSSDDLAIQLRAFVKQHRSMEKSAFWIGEILFYVALIASGCSTVLALTNNQNTELFKVVTTLPASILLIVGTVPLGARADWHGQFADRTEALLRRLQFQGRSVAIVSEEWTALTDRMRPLYPKARWMGGRTIDRKQARDESAGADKG